MGLKKKRFFPLILKNLFLPASGFWTYKVDLWLFDIGRHVEEAFWSEPLDIYTFLQYCSPLTYILKDIHTVYYHRVSKEEIYQHLVTERCTTYIECTIYNHRISIEQTYQHLVSE